MKQLDELMQKEMSRKEFLTLLVTGLVAAFGFTNIIHSLLQKSSHNSSKSAGYGSTPYGQ